MTMSATVPTTNSIRAASVSTAQPTVSASSPTLNHTVDPEEASWLVHGSTVAGTPSGMAPRAPAPRPSTSSGPIIATHGTSDFAYLPEDSDHDRQHQRDRDGEPRGCHERAHHPFTSLRSSIRVVASAASDGHQKRQTHGSLGGDDDDGDERDAFDGQRRLHRA